MAQTPTQRLANQKFAKQEEKKMGTKRAPKVDYETRKKMSLNDKFRGSPVAKWMVYLLVFILVGGIFMELLRLLFFGKAV